MNHDVHDALIAEWLVEGPAPGSRDGLERALAATRTIRQRPGWIFVERWLPMELTTGRVQAPRLVSTAALVILLALVLALAAAFVGSRRPLPAPIGLAGNGLMAFEAEEHIYVARSDGSQRRRLSSGLGIERQPAFSPDGTRIAFVSSAATDVGQLYVVPLDGSHEPIDVTGSLDIWPAHVSTFAWSPDSRYIAFTTISNGVTIIFVAASDGTGATAITDGTAIHDLPSWSPDGKWLAYRIARSDGSTQSLAIARSDGSRERIVTSVNGPGSTLGLSRWSPDGSRLTFYREADGALRAMAVDLDGHSTTILPEAAGALAIPWSPDGRSVALVTESDGIVLADPDGRNPRRLGRLADCWVDWSPDGTALYGGGPDRCGGVVVITLSISGPPTTRLLPAPIRGVSSWQRVAP
jgi:dipeptidyl aminopeptidase/acylaminoacyl peptidase